MRRYNEEEGITISAFPLGISVWGFWQGNVITDTPSPPPSETFFFVMQDGSRYLTQSGDKYIKNG